MQKIKSIRQLTKLFNKVPFIDSWFKRRCAFPTEKSLKKQESKKTKIGLNPLWKETFYNSYFKLA